jgi:N-acetylglutamate synthase-like GNAT family acetyltransferase
MLDICSYSASYQKEVLNLILKIQQEEFSIPITVDDQPDLTSIEEFYQKDGNFWVALYYGSVVGTVAVRNIGGGNAMLRKMFVRKEYRGQTKNVAGCLLLEPLKWAKLKQLQRIYLGTTPQYIAAHRFYEKNGFTEIRREDLPSNFPVMDVDKKFYCYALTDFNPGERGGIT